MKYPLYHLMTSGEIQKTIELKKNTGLWESIEVETTEGTSLFLDDKKAIGGDSVLVYFNDEKRRIHTLNNFFERNILYHQSYEIIQASDNRKIDRYTFTNADYELAEPIE